MRDSNGNRTFCMLCNQIVRDGVCFCNPKYYPLSDKVLCVLQSLRDSAECFYLSEFNRLPTAEEFSKIVTDALARMK